MTNKTSHLIWTHHPQQGFTPALWVGTTATGKDLFTIENRRRGRKVITYLFRTNGSAETCRNVELAKDYANALAHLANFPPLS